MFLHKMDDHSRRLLLLYSQQLNGQDDQAKNKNKQADTVDTVHITDPFTFRTIRVFFFSGTGIQLFDSRLPYFKVDVL